MIQTKIQLQQSTKWLQIYIETNHFLLGGGPWVGSKCEDVTLESEGIIKKLTFSFG